MSSNYLTADNGVSSGVTGITQSAGNDGTLQIRTTTSGGTATTAVTVDNAQNVGIGVTPSAWGVGTNGHALEFSNAGSMWNYSNTTGINLSQNVYYNGAYYYKSTAAATLYGQGSGSHIWYNAPSGTGGTTFTPTQAMTLDTSGNFLVGQTTRGVVNSNSFNLDINSSTLYVNHANGVATGSAYLQFGYNASVIGSITQTGTTAVLYNTTSDYRLKSNVSPVTTGLSVINQLNPVNFTWISDNEADTGFLAHEFQAVIPRTVTGAKDATKEEEYEVTPAVKDEQGNITTPAVMGTRTVPVYQQMDNSGAVPYLVAAIKELSAQVTSLKATVETQATTIATLQNKIGA